MEIKGWQKGLFFGSIGALIIYLQRDKIFRGLNIVKNGYNEFTKRLIAFADPFAGKIREVGDNAGFSNSVFQSMMKNIGWWSGAQWCMYFAKAMHYQAFEGKPEVQAWIKKNFTGSSQESFVNAKNDKTGTYTVVTSGKPKIGDIFILQHYNAPDTGHAGIVKAVHETTYDTIEGNTSKAGVSDGQGVFNLTRKIAYGEKQKGTTLVLRGFIRKT